MKYTVTADQNFMGTTFTDAYWKLTNFGFGEFNDAFIVAITLSAYPSRDASQKTKASSEVGYISTFGASSRPNYEAEIYTWNTSFPVEVVYPNGIPSSLADAKTIAYNFIKQYLYEIPFEDVFEEGQATETNTTNGGGIA